MDTCEINVSSITELNLESLDGDCTSPEHSVVLESQQESITDTEPMPTTDELKRMRRRCETNTPNKNNTRKR